MSNKFKDIPYLIKEYQHKLVCENYYGRGCSGINSYTAAPFLSVYLLEHVKKPIIN